MRSRRNALEMYQLAKCAKKLHDEQGLTVWNIAKRLGASRDTIQAILERPLPEPPDPHQRLRRRPPIDQQIIPPDVRARRVIDWDQVMHAQRTNFRN